MTRKKSSASQLDREIAAALAGKADLQKLVEKWKSAAAFSHSKAQSEPDDAEYRHGYAAAMETAVTDLRALIDRKA